MAAYTASVTGLWSAQATWGGSGPPGDGDTATVNVPVTVDVNTTVGASGAVDSVAISVVATGGNTGALTIDTGVTLITRGDLTLGNTSLTMAAGSTLTFDSSLAGGTPVYKLYPGTSASYGGGTTESNNKVIANGTAGSRCTINTAASSGRGVIALWFDGAVAAGCHFAYTDFNKIGTSTTGRLTDCMDISAIKGTQEAYIDNCTFTDCGRVRIRGVAATLNLQITNNRWVSTANTSYGLWVGNTAKTSGTRNISNNWHALDGQANWAMVAEFSVSGWTFENNVFNRAIHSSVGAGAMTSCKNNLHYQRTAGTTVPTAIDTAGTTLEDNYAINDTQTEGSGWWGATTVGAAGTITFDGNIHEISTPLEGTDAWHCASPSAITTYNIQNMLVLPNSRGGQSGNITFHGSSRVTANVNHCTLMSGQGAGAVTGETAIYLGSDYLGHTGFMPSIRSNLVWSKATPVSGGYVAWLHTGWPDTGTASAGTTTTLTDAAAAFRTTALETLALSGAKIVITGKSGSGPEVGEEATITANTGTQVTFTPAMSAAPDAGTTYKISGVDIVTPATVTKNATYNLIDGTIYDSDGGSGAAKRGYHNLWLTAAIGAADITLTAGSDETTEGPEFVDPTRNFATFDSAYLENSATAWADTTVYAVGDMVSAQTTTFYGNAVINYRCVTAHTSNAANATNGKPGSATSYRTNWEFATAYRIREATIAGTTITDASLGLTTASYIKTLHAWVQAGFAPQNTELQDAGHDDVTIGAVEGVFSSGSLYLGPAYPAAMSPAFSPTNIPAFLLGRP
jgi:hypothetical protein